MAEKHTSKYKAPKDLEKSQKPKPRKDLKDYTVEDKDKKMNPTSTGEKQKNVLRKTDKEVIDNGSLVPDMSDSDRAYKTDGKHDSKHAAKVMSKRQDDDEKNSKDSIKDKIENLTREQKERLVREMIRKKIKNVLKEQSDKAPEEETTPEPEAPAKEPTPAPAPAPAKTPEAPAPEPEAEAPAEEPEAAAAPEQDSSAQLNSFVTLVKNQPTSPEQIKMILKAVQKTGTMADNQGNQVINQGKLKELYRYLKIAADRMLEKYS